MLVEDSRIDRRVLDEARTLNYGGFTTTVIAGPTPTKSYKVDEENYPDVNIVRIQFDDSKELFNNFDKKKIDEIFAEFNDLDLDILFPNLKHFLAMALNFPADIYVAHDLPMLPFAAIAAAYYDSYLVYDSHELYPEQKFPSELISPLMKKIDKVLAPWADLVITVNQSIAEEMARDYRIPKPEVILNCPSFNKNEFKPGKSNVLRETLNISSRNKILLFQGNLIKEKRNLENLVNAMSSIKARDVILVLMGADYGAKENLVQTAKNKNLLNKRVFILDAVNPQQLLEYSASADAGIIPYPNISLNHYFCTPNKLFEFIVAEVPILANNLPELNRFVSGQKIGLNLPMTNSEDIAAAIDSFFNTDIEIYKANLKKISCNYHWDIQGKKLLKMYKGLFKNKPEPEIKKIKESINLIEDRNFNEAKNKLSDVLNNNGYFIPALNLSAISGYKENNLLNSLQNIKKVITQDFEDQTALNNLKNIADIINNDRKPGEHNTTNKKLNILIVLYAPTENLRSTVRDHIIAFEKYSNHNVYYLNLNYCITLPFEIKNTNFDLIIFHTKFLSARWNLINFKKIMNLPVMKQLSEFQAVKIAIPQDEFINTDILSDFINQFKIEHVFTNTKKTEWQKIFTTVDQNKVKFHQVLTGYLDDDTISYISRLSQKITERRIDIGYRAWHANESLGRHGQLKWQIADLFLQEAPPKGFKVDISTDDKDTILGNKWYEFLLNCRYIIGVEGGASLLDKNGFTRKLTEAYKHLYPGSSFEEIEEVCFPGLDGGLELFAISPRHLEACATRTCQVLVEGEYNEILKPGVHYIELKKDFSNIADVLDKLKDEKYRNKIVENAYIDIVESGKYSYQSFVDYVIQQSLCENNSRQKSINFTDIKFRLPFENKSEVKAKLNSNYIEHLYKTAAYCREINLTTIAEELNNIAADLDLKISEKLSVSSQIMFKEADYLGAYSAVKAALKKDEKNLDASLLYIDLLLKFEIHNDALKNINELSVLFPDEKRIKFKLAEILILLDKLHDAEKIIESVLTQDSNDTEALNLYGRIKILMHNYDHAKIKLDKSFKINSSNTQTLYLLGKLYNEISEYSKALEFFQLSLKISPKNINIWIELLSLAHKINDDQLGKASLKMIEGLDPQNPILSKYSRKNGNEKAEGKIRKKFVKGILNIYHHPFRTDAPTILEHVNSFGAYSNFEVHNINVESGFPEILKYFEFEIILLHYSLFGQYPFILNEHFQAYIGSCKSSYKVAFFQDEYSNCIERFEVINRLKIDSIFTVIEPEYWKDTYLKYTSVKNLHFTLTGYISDSFIKISNENYKPDKERTIDIGYRARQLPYFMGMGAQEKYWIGIEFKKYAKDHDLVLDIEPDGQKRIYGKDWYAFVANCRGVLGVESGVSLSDIDGSVKKLYDKLMYENPHAAIEEIYEKVLAPYEEKIPIRTVSPRHFEAAALKVCQILFEGNYIGLLKPMIHYIPLKKDFSNFDEVIKLFKDDEVRNRIAINAYDELIASGKYSYKIFIEYFDDCLIKEGFIPNKSQNAMSPDSFNWWAEIFLNDRGNFENTFEEIKFSIEKGVNEELAKIYNVNPEEAEKLREILTFKINDLAGYFSSLFEVNLFLKLLKERSEFTALLSKLKPKNCIDNPKFTIAIFTYNRADRIKRSIESGLKQTFNDHEILVIDDGSTDNTENIVAGFKSDKIRYIRKEHSGISSSRNRAIDEAKGDFILWLADDDEISTDTLESYSKCIEKFPDADVLYCQLRVVSGDSEKMITPKDWYKDKGGLLSALIVGTPLPDGGSVVNKKVYEKIGGYNTTFKRAMDYEFWSRVVLTQQFEVKLVDKVLYTYYIHNNNITGILNSNTDFSFEARILENIVENSPIELLCAEYDWVNDAINSKAEAYYLIAAKFLSYNDISNARKYFEKSIILKPQLKFKNVKIAEFLTNYVPDYNLDEGQRVMKEEKTNNSQYQKEIEDIVNYVNQNSFDDAYKLTVKLLSIPDSIEKIGESEYMELLNLAGTLSLIRQDLESAQQYFEKELTANPSSSRACIGLGEVYLAAEMYNESKVMFEWAVKYDPQNELTLESLAKINIKLGFKTDHNTLIQDEVFKQITKSEDLINQDKYEEAIIILQNILRQYPENLDALNNSAVAQILLGNYNKGLDFIEKVLELDKNNEIAIENLKYLMKITGVTSNDIKPRGEI